MSWPKTRIAPTPSGPVHLGNMYNFILTWWWARFHNGQLFLRIDDADHGRTRDIFLEDIFRSLEWIGIGIDGGPSGVDDFKKNFSQIKRRNTYFAQLKNLPTFVCQCRRSEIKRLSPNGAYPGTCHSKNLPWRPGLAMRWRGGTHNASLDDTLKDAVLWRKDDTPAYQLASVIDDREAGINFIVRGEDLRPSGDLQARLAGPLGWTFPQGENLIHHPLLRDSQGRKLSKSSQQTQNPWTLHTWRDNGKSFTSLIDLWAKQWNLPTGQREKKIGRLRDLLDYPPPRFDRN